MLEKKLDNIISEKIIGAAIEVHRNLGPGLLESSYEKCLARELDLRQISYQRQVQCPLEYKSVKLDDAFRIDFLIEKQVIVEIKAVQELIPIHSTQLITYLRFLNLKIGLLINFHVPILKSGIKRINL